MRKANTINPKDARTQFMDTLRTALGFSILKERGNSIESQLHPKQLAGIITKKGKRKEFLYIIIIIIIQKMATMLPYYF
jgi:hypothetical protein